MTTAPLLGPSHLGGMASPVVPGGRHVTQVIESTETPLWHSALEFGLTLLGREFLILLRCKTETAGHHLAALWGESLLKNGANTKERRCEK